MITFEDCLGFCDLAEEEVSAIAEHEHIPAMAALEMGAYLTNTADGLAEIERFISEDVERAELRGDEAHARELADVLAHFCDGLEGAAAAA